MAGVRKSVARASVSFNLAHGTEAGDLVIENDRLKTSVAIINSKLKRQEDDNSIIEDLRKKNKLLETENG